MNEVDYSRNDNMLKKIDNIRTTIPECIDEKSIAEKTCEIIPKMIITNELRHFNETVNQMTVNLSKLSRALLGSYKAS